MACICPLAFDAGANLIFRTDILGRSYGCAVDLDTLAEGAYEVVSSPVPIQPSFRLIEIGRLDERLLNSIGAK